jgi:2-polyprenyl-6-methoxyphenol hydroxylase-like FAD-dependent oxidoreductase
LAQFGLAVRRERRLDTLTVTVDGVCAELTGPAGREVVTAEYVVGCDGCDSTVRRLAGIDLVGAEPARQLLRADVAGISVADRRFERHERGLAVAVRRPDGITRIMTHEFGRHVDRPDFAAVVRAWTSITGEDISAGRPVWVDAFDDTGKQAADYRRGRVLLAGDAAHVQMPIGGQALNLGLQDAVNLGWKLAAQVRGQAAPGLLDTYHTERHAVGARTLASVEAQALLLLGSAEVDAMREVFAELVALPSVRDRLAATVSGLDVRYPVGEGHSLLGRRLPAVDGALSHSRTAALRTGHGVLLDLSGDHDRGAGLRAAARPWADRLLVFSGQAELGADAVLVRPDGHVVWADHGQDLESALHTWFGAGS